MEQLKKKEKSLTIRLSEEIFKKFNDYQKAKSNEIGTKLTQSQVFEILMNEQVKK